jgi:hypothetical protein
MKKSLLFALLGLLAVGMALVLLWPKPAPAPGVASVLYAGTTNVSATSRFGNGTTEHPFFDLVQLHITNLPASGRVGLFVLTNATFNNVIFCLNTIEVWQGGSWVEQAPLWNNFGWNLEPGKSCVQVVPEPDGNLPWRLRLGIQESPRGLKGKLDRLTLKTANTILYPPNPYEIYSPTILDGRAEPQSGADRSQPFRSETNRTSAAAGSGRSP